MTIQIIPDGAPFNDDQRAWLNGFFVGYLGLEGGVAADSDAAVEEDDEDYPWHDDTMPIEERMELAESKPFELKLMAAMGQQDCGQCGYLCKTYAQAIATGAEQDLTKCSPGGRPTSKQLKVLLADAPAISAPTSAPVPANESGGYDRDHPFLARVKSVLALNTDESEKDTRHVEIDLSGSGIVYRPGDALGIYPKNSRELAEQIVAKLGLEADSIVVLDNYEHTLLDLLANYMDITKPSDEVIQYFSDCAADESDKAALATLAEEGVEEGCDVLEILDEYSSIETVDAQNLVTHLARIQPRLYSISSSPNVHTEQVHATVGVVAYQRKNRGRGGVASTFLSHRLQAGDTVRVYIQPTHEFLLPEDPKTPVIMVGPGTGIAPFRAFLHERSERGDSGKNWLFFGNPSERNDFLYKEELTQFLEIGCLTRLDTAFSRDQEHKIYVQHRMLECGKEVWSWLQEGAYFYVCGDAQRMAKDVEAALCQIAQEEGKMTEKGAEDFIKTMAKNKRYLRDVY